jgi:hypothetical protein
MKLLQKIAIYYLLALILVGWGIGIGKYGVFPYSMLKEIKAFIADDDLAQKTSITQKLANDLGLVPERFIRSYPPLAAANTHELDIPGTKSRRDPALVYIDPEQTSGYRAVFGALDFEETLWGGILLNSQGEVVHTWQLSTDHLPGNKAPSLLKKLYGMYLFPDGSVIFSQQEEGGGLVKVDACSRDIWDLEGDFHHAVSPDENGNFWTFHDKKGDFDHKLALVSVATGEIIKQIDMHDVRMHNPFVHIFNLQRNINTQDISHGNDIEPLDSRMAPKFPRFKAGDLLLSYRTQNLLFVLDPDSLKVKWWKVGISDRQHDADWEADGRITVFSNNEVTARNYSDIIAIDPETREYRAIVNGEKYSFHSDINGRQQRTPFATRLVTSTTQGWVFEVDDNGRIVFSFVNNYDSEKQHSLDLTEAYRLPENYFDKEFWKTCTTK